jgi:hypothetical protein
MRAVIVVHLDDQEWLVAVFDFIGVVVAVDTVFGIGAVVGFQFRKGSIQVSGIRTVQFQSILLNLASTIVSDHNRNAVTVRVGVFIMGVIVAVGSIVIMGVRVGVFIMGVIIAVGSIVIMGVRVGVFITTANKVAPHSECHRQQQEGKQRKFFCKLHRFSVNKK